ncbi:E3 ubiquitin-protein ligase ring1-like protein, partial [Trifolium pratense]
DLALITRHLIPKVKQMFGFSDSFQLAIPNTGAPTVDIPLVLNIISQVQQQNGERIIQEVVEEPRARQSERMIPASNEVVSSLKAYSLHRNCSICMERFHDDLEEDGASDEVKVSTMVCGHIFHYSCIVKWLRTSHVCPLCRYAMPV